MAIIELRVTDQQIELAEPVTIVSGSENVYLCKFTFTEEWTGFEKTAVFLSRTDAREVYVYNNECIIPWEALEIDDIRRQELKIGVYGVKDDVRMPTVYTKPLTVHPGAETAEGGGTPTPTQWEEIMEMLADGTVYLDPTLTQSNKAAQADIVGDGLKKAVQSAGFAIRHDALQGYTTADDFPANRIIVLYSDITSSDIANLPVYGELAYIITPTYSASSAYSAQIFFGRYTMATRIKAVDGWTPWVINTRYLPLEYTDYASLAEVPEGVIYVIQSVEWTDVPPGATHGYLISPRISGNYKMQIYFEDAPELRTWWRIVHRTTFNVFTNWVTSPSMDEFNGIVPYVHKLITNISDYIAEKNITKLSQLTENVLMLENKNTFEDSPFISAILENTRYSPNYNVQTAYRYQTGQTLMRITNRTTGAPFTAWRSPSTIEAQTVLSMGDSICYGARNDHKGFMGDLALTRDDVSYPGARLSNTRVGSGYYFCIYEQCLHYLTDITKTAGYAPDVIISNGGINDYGNNVALGDIPTSLVTTDEEAEALNKATICGGLQYLFYLWIKHYPQAQRFFLLTHRDKTKPWTKNYTNGYTQTEMNEAIKAVCALYSVEVIDVFNESMINSAFSQYVSPESYNASGNTEADKARITNSYYVDNDGVHPLDLGYREGYVPLVRKALVIATHKPQITDFSGDVVRLRQLTTGEKLKSVVAQIADGGRTHVDLMVTKKNMLLRPYMHEEDYTNRGITFVVQENGTIKASGTLSGTSQPYDSLKRVWLQPGVVYSISHGCNHSRAFCVGYFRDYTNTQNITPDGWDVDLDRAISQTYVSTLNNNAFRAKRTFYVNEPCVIEFQIRFSPTSEAQTVTDAVFKPMLYIGGETDDWDTAPTYEVAQGQLISIPLGTTVDEGELNVTTGELTVTQPSAATYQLAPTEVATLNGYNQIVADTGAVSVVRSA